MGAEEEEVLRRVLGESGPLYRAGDNSERGRIWSEDPDHGLRLVPFGFRMAPSHCVEVDSPSSPGPRVLLLTVWALCPLYGLMVWAPCVWGVAFS